MLITKVSKETNFVYHMLSVAKCGYNNEYGSIWRKYHSDSDLNIIKKNEGLLTVKGGKHCGELYWLLVMLPASLGTPAKDYYSSLNKLYKTGDKGNFNPINQFEFPNKQYSRFTAEIIEICDVMERNYDIYEYTAWEHSRKDLLDYADYMQNVFDNNKIAAMLESIIGQTFKTNFIATFCNSLDYGAEAIDISAEQDVFGIGQTCGRTYEIAENFIMHEYAIYLLKQVLAESGAFDNKENWIFLETLAEFYHSKVVGETGMSFGKCSDILDIYTAEADKNPKITAAVLLKQAKAKYICQ